MSEVTKADMNNCPVCGYQLRIPVEDFLICPCCGTQFGYTDAIRSHAELRQQWIRRGRPWHSVSVSPTVAQVPAEIEE